MRSDIYFIAAAVDDDGTVYIDRPTFDLVYDVNTFDFDTSDDLNDIQHQLDNLIKRALDFGTPHANYAGEHDDLGRQNNSIDDLLDAAVHFTSAAQRAARRHLARNPVT